MRNTRRAKGAIGNNLRPTKRHSSGGNVHALSKKSKSKNRRCLLELLTPRAFSLDYSNEFELQLCPEPICCGCGRSLISAAVRFETALKVKSMSDAARAPPLCGVTRQVRDSILLTLI